MNTLNLTKTSRYGESIPEKAEQAVIQMLFNALDHIAIVEDKADFWEEKYNELHSVMKVIARKAEVHAGRISFASIFEKFDKDDFEDVLKTFNLTKIEEEEN